MLNFLNVEQKGQKIYMKQNQVKQWLFVGLGFTASILAILGLGFRIFVPFLVLIAATLFVVVVILGIRLLGDRYFGDQHEKSSK
jgi:hypothetical protein